MKRVGWSSLVWAGAILWVFLLGAGAEKEREIDKSPKEDRVGEYTFECSNGRTLIHHTYGLKLGNETYYKSDVYEKESGRLVGGVYHTELDDPPGSGWAYLLVRRDLPLIDGGFQAEQYDDPFTMMLMTGFTYCDVPLEYSPAQSDEADEGKGTSLQVPEQELWNWSYDRQAL